MRIRALVLVGLAALLAAAYVSGFIDTVADRQRLEDFLTSSGPLGPVAFVALFAVSHPVGLPSVILVFVAALVWPIGIAVVLSWCGAMLGTFLGFSVARWLGRAWVARRVPPRIRRLDERLTGRGVLAVVTVRLLLYLPPPADWLFGVSGMRRRDFMLGTAIGVVPPTIVIALIGDNVVDVFRSVSVPVVVGSAVGAVALALWWVIARRSASQGVGRRRDKAIRRRTR